MEKHKFWIIAGVVVAAGGLVITWMNYESNNQAASNSNANAAEEDALLQSLMAAPLSSASGTEAYNAPSTVSDGSSALDSLISAILNPGSSASSTTSSGSSSSTGSSSSSGSGSTDNGNPGTTTVNSPITTPAPPVYHPIAPVGPVKGVSGRLITSGGTLLTNTSS